MSKLETVVRPFQAGDVFTARVLPPVQPPAAPPAPITATWGKGISLLSTAIGKTDFKFGVVHTEVDRKTHTVRVTNPDDENQFVDVQRIDQLRLKDENGVMSTWNLNNP
jgi:hypothetical protein